MSERNRSTDIKAAVERVNALRLLSSSASPVQRGILQEVFGELDATIEELRVAEEELRMQNMELIASRDVIEQERYRYQALFEFAPIGYLATDLYGVISEANSAAAVLLNVSSKYLKGKPLANYVTEERRREFRNELLNLQSDDYLPEWETEIQPKQAGSFHAGMTVATIRDDNNELIGLRWLLRDITERKRSQARIQALTEDLEQQVEARTAQLTAAYQREKRIAEVLQRSLLRTPPAELFPNMTIAAFYEAALDEAQIGGDFYDIFLVDKNKAALVVGDVSGKGLFAAACTAQIKYALRTYLHDTDLPGEALTRLNRFLCDSGMQGEWQNDLFATLTLAIIDQPTGLASISLAGAESPILLRQSGAQEEMRSHHLALGIQSGYRYDAQEFQFQIGDTLLITTDGITEARSGAEFLGIEGLIAIAGQARSVPSLQTMGEMIMQRAHEFTAGKLSDDACLLLAQWRSPAGS